MRVTSLWADQAGHVDPRPPLERDLDADVVVVGAGYSGLWTAYYLLGLRPDWRVVVLEREHVGFGASGRNGGWAVGEFANHDAPIDQLRAAFDAVTEIGRVCAAEGIDADYRRGGTVRLARTQPQLMRQRAEVAGFHRRGFDDADIHLLDAGEATARLAATGVVGGLWFAHTAVVQPLKLARGLAAAVERRGGVIYERTPAVALDDGVLTPGGRVRADAVVLAVEAYQRDLPGRRRTLVPLYSQMIATEPLPGEVWDSIGLADRETFADDRYLVIYGQRTADDRIAFGARGDPAYLFGSRISRDAETRAHARIAATLRELLPQVAGAEITHRWGGVLGVPRDWRPSVVWDERTRLGVPGGYVGEGVAAANLAGRTLAELIAGEDSERTHLAWVGHRSRRWEPEPLRWAAINAAFAALGWADAREARTGKPSLLARRLMRLIGKR